MLSGSITLFRVTLGVTWTHLSLFLSLSLYIYIIVYSSTTLLCSLNKTIVLSELIHSFIKFFFKCIFAQFWYLSMNHSAVPNKSQFLGINLKYGTYNYGYNLDEVVAYEDLKNSLFLPLWLYIRIPISKIPIHDMKH